MLGCYIDHGTNCLCQTLTETCFVSDTLQQQLRQGHFLCARHNSFISVLRAKWYLISGEPHLACVQDTYRYHGHSISDPGSTYRTRDEISGIRRARDPIEHVKTLLTENNFAEGSDLKKREKQIKREVSGVLRTSNVFSPSHSCKTVCMLCATFVTRMWCWFLCKKCLHKPC